MALIQKITCDGCGRDLTTTGNCEGYRLMVAVEPIASRSGLVTMMAVERPLAQSQHFCGMPCLAKWASDYDKRQAERHAEERQRAKDEERAQGAWNANAPCFWDGSGGGW